MDLDADNLDPLLADWPFWLDDFLGLTMPEAEWQAILSRLLPGKVPADLLQSLWLGLRRQAVELPSLSNSTMLMDCCGTGGSGLPHYNTSTTVAFVLAAGGVSVLKFGNRAVSSKSGSFDFLDSIGLPATASLETTFKSYEQTGLGFLFAPAVYPGLKAFHQRRKAYGGSTVFNYLGPLLHPYEPPLRLVGVSNAAMLSPMASLLREMCSPTKQALLVSSASGLDEVEPEIKAAGQYLKADAITPWQYDGDWTSLNLPPTEFDLPPPDYSSSAGNAEYFKALLANELPVGHPVTRMVTCNAGLGFKLAGAVDSWPEGVVMAYRLLRRGTVLKLWEAVKAVYNA